MNKINVKIKKLHPEAIVPTYAKEGDAGADLCAIINEGELKLQAKETTIIGTGLAMEIPLGYELQIRPRSGLSLRTKLRLPNSPGTIDAGFRNEVKIIIENTGDKPIVINHHDRVAQGVLKEVPQANFIVVDELSDSDRGLGGLGHTGIGI